MSPLVEYFNDDRLCIGLVIEQGKKKLTVIDDRGRTSKVPLDKILFHHTASSIETFKTHRNALEQDIDVPLLWESLLEDGDLNPRNPQELARLYFDADGSEYCSAIFRVLNTERLHFRRRGRSFEPRSADDLKQLKEQLDIEQRIAQERQALDQALRKRKPSEELCQRLERLLRFGGDKLLMTSLEQLSKHPYRFAFDLLLEVEQLPKTADLEVIQANLQPDLPVAVVEYATGLRAPVADSHEVESSFAIDDPDTMEVDDALSVCKDGELFRVDVDIADVASLVSPGDPVDQEALRRATTIYLPTHTYFMLPERLGCDLLSLEAGTPRPALRTSVWLDSTGKVIRYTHKRVFTTVFQRLNYDTADQLIASDQGTTAEELRLLGKLSSQLAERRRASGSITFRQREWKVHVSKDGEMIKAKLLPHDSASRSLVAEMMILTNTLAAQLAYENDLPIIYRVQPPPAEIPPTVEPDDPAAFSKLRHLLQPATLSLYSARHWGLGVERYTQTTSPLRRYTDLVIQRQIQASLAGKIPPYGQDELLRVLGAAEATEREGKRLENVVKERWALEYVERLEDRKKLGAWILDKVTGGWLVELTSCGARGLLMDDRAYEPGELLLVNVKTLRPRRGIMRLLPA